MLRIDMGRREGLRLEERVCEICGDGSVEDERHFVMDCGAYKEEREEMYERINGMYGGRLDLSRCGEGAGREVRFDKLIGRGMKSKYEETYDIVKDFVQKAVVKRRNIARGS
jgi:hypothetical protein